MQVHHNDNEQTEVEIQTYQHTEHQLSSTEMDMTTNRYRNESGLKLSISYGSLSNFDVMC